MHIQALYKKYWAPFSPKFGKKRAKNISYQLRKKYSEYIFNFCNPEGPNDVRYSKIAISYAIWTPGRVKLKKYIPIIFLYLDSKYVLSAFCQILEKMEAYIFYKVLNCAFQGKIIVILEYRTPFGPSGLPKLKIYSEYFFLRQL